MNWLLILAGFILTPGVKHRRQRRIERAEEQRFNHLVALSFITRLYARHGTDGQLEDCYDMWHDRPAWEPFDEAAWPEKPWWPRWNKRVHGVERPWEHDA